MEDSNNMNDFFREHLWGALVAIMLALGTGYFSFRLTMSAFQEKVGNIQNQVNEIESDVETLQNRRETLRIDVTRMEIKINALLRDRGIDPDKLSVTLREER